MSRESSISAESSERGSTGELRTKSPSESSGKLEAKTSEEVKELILNQPVQSKKETVADSVSSKNWKSKSVSPEVELQKESPFLCSRVPPRSKSDQEVAVSDEQHTLDKIQTTLSFTDTVVSKSEGQLKPRPYDNSDAIERAGTPTILIEPNSSLELTQDMIGSGESEVITTVTDAPRARARRSRDPGPGIVITSDDEESLDGEGGEEEVDQGGGEASGGAGVRRGKGKNGRGKDRRKAGKASSRASYSPTDDNVSLVFVLDFQI